MSLAHSAVEITRRPVGLAHAKDALRLAVLKRSDLLPELHDRSDRTLHHRTRLKILSGEKPMSLDHFNAFLGRLSRRQPETALRLLNTWLAEHGFLVSLAPGSSLRRVKGYAEEVAESAAAMGRLLAAIETFRADGELTDFERQEIARLTDRAIEETRDIAEVIG